MGVRGQRSALTNQAGAMWRGVVVRVCIQGSSCPVPSQGVTPTFMISRPREADGTEHREGGSQRPWGARGQWTTL